MLTLLFSVSLTATTLLLLAVATSEVRRLMHAFRAPQRDVELTSDKRIVSAEGVENYGQTVCQISQRARPVNVATGPVTSQTVITDRAA
jgi:hypothetical protein